MKFYSRFPGSRVIMPSGKPLVFSAGGSLETEDKDEIKEMMYQCKEGYASQQPLPIAVNDAQVMKEVGSPKAGTGMVNSAALAALASDSN